MADISSLGGLNPVEVLDLSDGVYQDAKESTFRLPAAGKYTVQSPDSFPTAAFGRTKAGALSIQIDPTILGPTNEGFTIRYVKISGKQFDRSGQKVSQIGDYLRAVGFKGTLRDEQAQADAVESTAGAVYEVKLDWRAYNSKTGFSLEGMSRFPKLADGSGYQSWVEDHGDIDEETGNPKRVRANLIVTMNGFVPKA